MKRVIMSILPIVAILSIVACSSNVCCETVSAVELTDSKSIQVATYNIRYNNPNDGENWWENRKDKVNQLIRYYEWDIFGTQEGLKDQIDYIATLDEYAHYGKARDNGVNEGEHSAIFYRKSRFELLDCGDFWLSTTPDEPSYGWDANIKRICSWVKLADKENNNKEFYFFDAHYDHQGVIARRESSKLMVAKIAEIAKDAPVIFVGDLNAKPDDEVHDTLREVLNDSYNVTKEAPYGPYGTANGFDWDRELVDRIDYIYVNNSVEVQKYAVIGDSYNRLYPSDHLPVVARILVK